MKKAATLRLRLGCPVGQCLRMFCLVAKRLTGRKFPEFAVELRNRLAAVGFVSVDKKTAGRLCEQRRSPEGGACDLYLVA